MLQFHVPLPVRHFAILFLCLLLYLCGARGSTLKGTTSTTKPVRDILVAALSVRVGQFSSILPVSFAGDVQLLLLHSMLLLPLILFVS